MTISYAHDVATCSGFGCFWKVLWRWKGSIYKLLWKDLCAFLALYFAVSAVYRYGLDESSKTYFEKVVTYINGTYTKVIPLSFVLGFYVSVVMSRWWDQVSGVPFPDMPALYVSSCMTDNKSPRARMFRRTIVRYLNASFVMCMAMVSPRVKRRFPTLDHVIEAGLLTEHEKDLIGEVSEKVPHSTWWLPIVWSCGTTKQAYREGMLHGERSFLVLLERITNFRSACGKILGYDWISVPLVYTQVVTIAVYSYFLSDLFGSQWIAKGEDDIDLYIPLFPSLQFLFYMGWLKVAEVLMNPFGDDDEDFELNWLIDRNIQMTYLIADDLHEMHPELTRDIHWLEGVPQDIPHTIASEMQKEEPFIDGSTAHITAESLQEGAEIAPSPMFDDASTTSSAPGKGTRSPANARRSVKRSSKKTKSVKSRPGSRTAKRNFQEPSALHSMSISRGNHNPYQLDESSLEGTPVKSRHTRTMMTQVGDSGGVDSDWEDVVVPDGVAGSYSNKAFTHDVSIDIPANQYQGSPKLPPYSAVGNRRLDPTKPTGRVKFEVADVAQSQQDKGSGIGDRSKPLATLEEGDEARTNKS